jgi:heavy metal sensor kinase
MDLKSTGWLSPSQESCVQTVFHYQAVENQSGMVMCHLILLDGRLTRLYLGGSLEEEFNILRTYRDALLLLTPVLLSLSALSGYLLSRHAMKPVHRMTRAATEIGIGNLSARLPVPLAKDEVQDLAIAWNQLLGRLEDAVTRLSQFSADVSHDLRTSITVILATAQLSLRRHRSEQEYRDDLDRIVTECRSASTLLDALLSLARSDSFVHEAAFQRIDLREFVVAGCRRVEDLAESSGVRLDWILPDEALYVEGDEALLHRLLGILLDNAIKYTPEGGDIRVEVARTANHFILSVRDTGIGMSDDVQQHIFSRFYQADLRERKTQAGSGLGLAIAKWIALAHRIELSVKSTPVSGSVFEVRFPTTGATQFPLRVEAIR